MLRKLGLLWILLIFSSLFSFSYAFDRNEEILNYVSHIAINKNASIDVTEKITVYAKLDKIKNGVVRWLPEFYIDQAGIKHPIHYQIKDVSLNHISVPYRLERKNNQIGIHIEKENGELEQGTYIYSIQYQITNLILSSGGHSKLAWNITGNDWDIPMVNVTAEVELPKGTTFTSFTANTGLIDKHGYDFTTTRPDNSLVIFQLTRPIKSNESLSVALSWPTIPFVPPLTHKLKSNLLNPIVIPIGMTFILIIYYLFGLIVLKKKKYSYDNLSLNQNKKFLRSIYLLLGVILSLGILLITFYKTNYTQALSAIFWLTIWTYCCYRILLWFRTSTMKNKNNILPLLLMLAFFTTEILGIYLFGKMVSFPTMFILSAIAIINLVFYHSLKRPLSSNQWYAVSDFSLEKD